MENCRDMVITFFGIRFTFKEGSVVGGLPTAEGHAKQTKHRGDTKLTQPREPYLPKSRSLEGVPGSPGKSQKEGQEEQGAVIELGGGTP